MWVTQVTMLYKKVVYLNEKNNFCKDHVGAYREMKWLTSTFDAEGGDPQGPSNLSKPLTPSFQIRKQISEKLTRSGVIVLTKGQTDMTISIFSLRCNNKIKCELDGPNPVCNDLPFQ